MPIERCIVPHGRAPAADCDALVSAPVLAGVGLASVREWIAGSGVGMGFLDTDLRFVESNAALASIFGVEALGGIALSMLAPNSFRTERLVRQVLRTGRPITTGAALARLSYFRVVDDDGIPIGVGVVSAADPAGEAPSRRAEAGGRDGRSHGPRQSPRIPGAPADGVRPAPSATDDPSRSPWSTWTDSSC